MMVMGMSVDQLTWDGPSVATMNPDMFSSCIVMFSVSMKVFSRMIFFYFVVADHFANVFSIENLKMFRLAV